jgi:hypothetical protein
VPVRTVKLCKVASKATAAEQQVVAANAEIGVATADFFLAWR